MGKKKNSIYNHPRLSSLIVSQPVLPFRDLPVEYQDALIHYMSVDGAAWAVEDSWPDWKWGEGQPDTEYRSQVMADISKFRSRFIEAYGYQKFGCCSLPYQTLIESVNGDESFRHHNRQYIVGEELYNQEYETPTWPVILSDFHDETFQDGWNRFGVYCHRKMDVPVTWYDA